MSDCNHKWSEETHEGVLSRCCHVCNEWEVEAELTRLRAENDRLKASRLPDVEYARLDVMWQQLVRERDELKSRLAHAEADAEQAVHGLQLALRNVLMLSKRIRKTDPENAEHLARFCREAGIEDSILRGEES